MRTEARLKEALKGYMTTKPLEEINVTLLCKKCNIHRQTFYYHYQDINDLLSAILLNEVIVGLKEVTTTNGVLDAFIKYTSKNLKFLQATYASSSKDQINELYFVRIYNRLLNIFAKNDKNYTKADCRTIARRFSKCLSDEFMYCFSDPDMNPAKLERHMKKFGESAIEITLPAIIETYKKEKSRKV